MFFGWVWFFFTSSCLPSHIVRCGWCVTSRSFQHHEFPACYSVQTVELRAFSWNGPVSVLVSLNSKTACTPLPNQAPAPVAHSYPDPCI